MRPTLEPPIELDGAPVHERLVGLCEGQGGRTGEAAGTGKPAGSGEVGARPAAGGGDEFPKKIQLFFDSGEYMTPTDPYSKLRNVLDRAFEQAAIGKGKERHANDGVLFEDQPMSAINKTIGSIDGFLYQAGKKSLEAKRLPAGRDVAELLGAINYLAGAVIALESWAAK